MKKSLYKSRLALLLAVVLSFQGVIPVNAAGLSGNMAAAAVSANTISKDTVSKDTAGQ